MNLLDMFMSGASAQDMIGLPQQQPMRYGDGGPSFPIPYNSHEAFMQDQIGKARQEGPPPNRQQVGLLDFASEHIGKGMDAYQPAPTAQQAITGLMGLIGSIPQQQRSEAGAPYQNPYLAKLGGF